MYFSEFMAIADATSLINGTNLHCVCTKHNPLNLDSRQGDGEKILNLDDFICE